MRKTLCSLLVAFACVVVGGSNVYAKDPFEAFRKDPLLRLKKPLQDKGSGSQNVIMSQVSFEDLPEYMKDQAVIAAKCAGERHYVQQIKYYLYLSDYHRSKKLPPNYIMDMSAFKDKNFRSCNVGELCENGQCALIGYASDESGWFRSFYKMMYRWTIEYAPRLNEKDPQVLWIDTVSMRDGSCVSPDGSDTEEGCFRRYEWREGGLAPVAVR